MDRPIRYSKLKWEFWPMWLANIPVCIIYLFFSLRARNMFFFSTVNPKFENGALMGASKINILNALPKEFLPKTAFISKNTPAFDQAINEMKKMNIHFPVILKPNVGERGLLVELIKSDTELKAYLETNKIDYLLQEFVALPNEASIFYYRIPSEKRGKISSVALKDYLKVTGDGISNIRSLLKNHFHGRLQIERLEKDKNINLSSVPEKGEELLLEPIGNHCRGTKILNGNHLISKNLESVFDQINNSSDNVFYGRYDLKYKDWESLLKGENFKIIEFNGVASEPMHIYDSSIPVVDKYKSFYILWKKIFQISKIQRKNGIKPMSAKEAIQYLRTYFKYIKSINPSWRDNINYDKLVLNHK